MPQKASWCRRNHRGTAQTTVAQHKLLWHSTNHPVEAWLGAPGRAGGTELVWGGLATPGGTILALQVTAGSGWRSSHGGGELWWETLLPRFAYSFMMMKKLIRCPSLHADSPNTPLRYLFSLVSLAPQTTHSTAQNRLAPPCSSSPCPHTRTWATTFCWGNAPAPDTPVLWGMPYLKAGKLA